jgi:putative transposase
MANPLQDAGLHVGRAQAWRLRHQAGVTGQGPRRRGAVTTDSRHGDEGAPPVLARQFDVAAPDHVWTGDITARWPAEGWLYRAGLVDLSARTVVGWARSHPLETTVVQAAWQRALGRRAPSAGVMHQADRGRQDASHTDQDRLAAQGMICRMSEQGEGLDQAVAERFCGRLTRAGPVPGDSPTRQEARDKILDDIARCYNSTRTPSYLGDGSPQTYEKCALVASLRVRFALTTTVNDGPAPVCAGMCAMLRLFVVSNTLRHMGRVLVTAPRYCRGWRKDLPRKKPRRLQAATAFLQSTLPGLSWVTTPSSTSQA